VSLDLLDPYLDPEERVLWSASAWPGMAPWLRTNLLLLSAVGLVALALVAQFVGGLLQHGLDFVALWKEGVSAGVVALSVGFGAYAAAYTRQRTHYFVTTHRAGKIVLSAASWVRDPRRPRLSPGKEGLLVEFPRADGEELTKAGLREHPDLSLYFLAPLSEQGSLRAVVRERWPREEQA
jgi:hypothetical protein